MKKTILKAAVATALIVPTMVMAEATLYGNVHLSLNAADNDVTGAQNELDMSSNTSAIGVKGSEDLGDGMKAIYKVEFGVDLLGKADTTPDTTGLSYNSATGEFSATGGAPNEGTGTLTGRDQWVGLKGGMGTVKLGTMSSNYKQMGGKVDPLYRTPLEGRGFLGTQSADLHGGRGVNRGRQTNTVQYSSPKMGGMQLVANTTFSGSSDESMGLGIRYATKNILAYVDWIDSQINTTGSITLAQANAAVFPAVITSAQFDAATKSESAVKVGGKYSTNAFSVALQWEGAEDRTGADYIFAAGTFNIDKNNMIALTYGMTDVKVAAGAPSADTDGVALAYNHKMSKMTNVYVGYGAKSVDVAAGAASKDESMFTVGMKKKF